MTHKLTTDNAKNHCNRTPIVQVILQNVVTCFFWDTVYARHHCSMSAQDTLLTTVVSYQISGKRGSAAAFPWKSGRTSCKCPAYKALFSVITKLRGEEHFLQKQFKHDHSQNHLKLLQILKVMSSLCNRNSCHCER